MVAEPATRIRGRWVSDASLDPVGDAMAATRILGRWIDNAVLDPGGGGEMPDFSGYGSDLATTRGWVDDVTGMITALEGDTGGDSVAGVKAELDQKIITEFGVSLAAVTILSTAYGDSIQDLTDLATELTAASAAANAIHENLDEDVGGNSVAQAIIDLGALQALINAF